MWNFIAKKTVTLVLPVVVASVVSFFFSVEPPINPSPPTVRQSLRVSRKKRDTSVLTKFHYDYVMFVRADWKAYNKANPKSKKYTEDLVNLLNEKFGLDKEQTAYSRIWMQREDRNNMPDGVKLFDY